MSEVPLHPGAQVKGVACGRDWVRDQQCVAFAMVNPHPSTLHLQPSTLNPEPSTLNPRH